MRKHGGRLALMSAALLTLAIVGTGSAMAASPTPAAAAKAAAQKAGVLEKISRHIVHGTFTIQRPDGTLQTLQIDRGTIASISGGTITVSQPGGTQTIGTDAQTRVRKNGVKSDVSKLAVGDKVAVVSDLTTGSAVADLIIVPRPRPATLPAG